MHDGGAEFRRIIGPGAPRSGADRLPGEPFAPSRKSAPRPARQDAAPPSRWLYITALALALLAGLLGLLVL
jgi:hypothetical protein